MINQMKMNMKRQTRVDPKLMNMSFDQNPISSKYSLSGSIVSDLFELSIFMIYRSHFSVCSKSMYMRLQRTLWNIWTTPGTGIEIIVMTVKKLRSSKRLHSNQISKTLQKLKIFTRIDQIYMNKFRTKEGKIFKFPLSTNATIFFYKSKTGDQYLQIYPNLLMEVQLFL